MGLSVPATLNPTHTEVHCPSMETVVTWKFYLSEWILSCALWQTPDTDHGQSLKGPLKASEVFLRLRRDNCAHWVATDDELIWGVYVGVSTPPHPYLLKKNKRETAPILTVPSGHSTFFYHWLSGCFQRKDISPGVLLGHLRDPSASLVPPSPALSIFFPVVLLVVEAGIRTVP
jgi:hypothetical protein